MQRIDAARDLVLGAGGANDVAGAGSTRVIELVNLHEKLREQVAETLSELDGLLEKLDDEQ